MRVTSFPHREASRSDLPQIVDIYNSRRALLGARSGAEKVSLSIALLGCESTIELVDHEVERSGFGESQSAGGCSLHRLPKPNCAVWLPFRIVRNLVQEFRFHFCEEASSTHSPGIFLAFAKTSSAGMRRASPRSWASTRRSISASHSASISEGIASRRDSAWPQPSEPALPGSAVEHCAQCLRSPGSCVSPVPVNHDCTLASLLPWSCPLTFALTGARCLIARPC